MGETTIIIPVSEYEDLLEIKIRAELVEEYVSKSKYCIDKREVANILAFELKEVTEDDVD